MPPEGTVYLDCNASTPCDPRVVEAMVPLLEEGFANPSSRNHRAGQRAAELLEEARARTARALGARHASEIILTSGATEANNLALLGTASRLEDRGRHLVSQVTEHPSVLEPLRHLETQGWTIILLEVGADGRIRLDELEEALDEGAVLISLMLANNETGSVQPVAEAVRMAHDRDVLVHCDAAQAPGKLELDLAGLGVDLATVSAHKAYGPKGVGALYCRRRRPAITPRPVLFGGGQESGLRPGTPNLPAIAGMARALEIARDETDRDSEHTARLRDRLEQEILDELDGCAVNGAPGLRLPNTSNLSFAGVDGNALLASLADIAASSGSACSSVRPEPSPVLRAMGVGPELAAASLRFSVGRFTSADEVDHAVERVVAEVRRLRQTMSPRLG